MLGQSSNEFTFYNSSLFAAMEGVNYIADHTRKEEESTKVNTYLKYHSDPNCNQTIKSSQFFFFFKFQMKMVRCYDALRWHLISPWN